MDEIIQDFLVESFEGLERLDTHLVELENNPEDTDVVAGVFRIVHTIKGTSGFFGFERLEKVTHVGENLLSRVRDGELTVTPEIISALLAMSDVVRSILERVEETGGEGDGDYTKLVERLTRLNEGTLQPEASDAPATPDAPAESASEEAPAAEATPTVSEAQAQADNPEDAPKPEAAPPSPAPQAEAPAEASPKADKSEKPEGGDKTSVAKTSIRVDVDLLDSLMNLVGELVLARNQIIQFSTAQSDSAFHAASQRLNLITTELQESVMKTRMQPVGTVWNKFPRIVRDLSVACGKKVRIEMQGKSTEVDKTIIEAIKDPLTHIVRNAVDHGIEPPEAREVNEKPEEGVLSLRAYHEGGQVNIEIKDDGGGINVENVKAKAVQREILTKARAERISERDALQLIFHPGFSTAEKITNVSGRGVGMDVVKTNIERIGGTVDIQSVLHEGTTLKIKIPLTLAIIPALMVTAKGDRYAIPQVSLLELVRIDGEMAESAIEMVHGVPVYRLRGNLLPIVFLNEQLQVNGGLSDDDSINIVVLQADDRQFGLVVDEIQDTLEIVVKPLGKQLKGIPIFAGATILGDGTVALILDVLGLAQRAQVISELSDRGLLESAASRKVAAGTTEALLLFTLGDQSRFAVPLATVDRLEELTTSDIEMSGRSEVVQYRGAIMPLLRLSQAIDLPSAGYGAEEPQSSVSVVVYTHEGQSVGLVVDRIIDVVDAAIQVEEGTERPCIHGAFVVQDRVTELIDLGAAVAQLLGRTPAMGGIYG